MTPAPRPSIRACASSNRSTGTRASASRVAGTPSISASRAPIRAASAAGMTWWAAPLCRTARRNRPSARGMDSRSPMDIAPADSPKTVTRPGSPPKAAMLSRTQRKRGDLVEQPEVGAVVAVAEIEEAVGARAPVDGDADHAVAGEAAAVVAPAGGEAEGAAGAPDHHRQPDRSRVRGPDVEVQAVVAHHRGVEEHPGRVVAGELRLRRFGPEGCRRRGHRSTARPAAAAAAGWPDRRRRVRDAQEGVYPVGGETAHPAVLGLHDRGPPLLLARHADRLLHHQGGPGWRNSAESKVPMNR